MVLWIIIAYTAGVVLGIKAALDNGTKGIFIAIATLIMP
jgi:hypothetical protein